MLNSKGWERYVAYGPMACLLGQYTQNFCHIAETLCKKLQKPLDKFRLLSKYIFIQQQSYRVWRRTSRVLSVCVGRLLCEQSTPHIAFVHTK
jgi:hypothetical protein